jgi:leucyl-tRNA synthetase
MSSTTAASSPTGATPPSDVPPFRYTGALAGQIETRWQAHWDERGTFITPNPGEPGFDGSKPKFYCMDMFPYPSGAGLHVGHPEGYTATDIVCRYKRMKGYRVLHPMGWDAFGLPAEQYAIQTGVHPALTTRRAIDTFRRQLKRFGFSYDWSREIATIDPDYYKWTQWIWLRAYNAWYDAESRRARPISDLIAQLEGGDARVSMFGEIVHIGERANLLGAGGMAFEPVGTQRWHELSAKDQRRFIDEQRLAYLAEVTVNWCPKLGTVLANEEVIDGKSERGGFPVYRRPLRQWMFRITAYADRLLADLETLDWPESTRKLQTDWIGRSEGAEIDFPLVIDGAQAAGMIDELTVFTTRPDTVFGATYMVVAPEHPLVEQVLAVPPPAEGGADVAGIRRYVEAARNRADVERMAEAKQKTGVFLGVYVTNPATRAKIPVWTADYVLTGYGTGAIMAVPGQDQRDWDFAKAFGLPIIRTVRPPEGFEGETFTGDGPAMNSGFLDGLHVAEAKKKIVDWLEKEGLGRRRVNYKLRDWLFSRQRYWGEPFPIVYDADGNHYPVAESALPVTLPALEDYTPPESDDPVPLLSKATGWVDTTAGEAGVSPELLPPETPVRRETNTMPGWAGSCWYYLRYCDPKNAERFCSRDAERAWMLGKRSAGRDADQHAQFVPGVHHLGGVDLYIGGSEHAVLHLLYARFWHKILFDLGEVSTPEPFGKLFHQGMITSYAYQRGDKTLVPTDQVEEIEEGVFREKATRTAVTQVVAKMSKALKNVVNPDDVIGDVGADTFRLYEMYMGPLEATKPWSTRDMVGMFRFLQRAWRLAVDEQTGEPRLAREPSLAVERQLHKTVAKVEHDIERLALNTAIAALIEFVNTATKEAEARGTHGGGVLTKDQLERLALVLAPFAPHMAEELWSRLGHDQTLAYHAWPVVDAALAKDDTVEIPVQVNGKLRHKITVPAGADARLMEGAAMADERVKAAIKGKTVRKVIVVPGRLVNIVVS